jgi:hypothetical protein
MSFIEARHGSSYSIKIKNDNFFRVMAVVSVDGLDVITGKPAEKSNTGYIIDGYSATEIKGYRVSDEASAAFVFVSKEGSYSAQVSGNSGNSGVLGVRIFDEKILDPIPSQMIYRSAPLGKIWPANGGNHGPTLDWMEVDYSKQTISPATQAYSSNLNITANTFDTGTSWGKKQEDKVKHVVFHKNLVISEMVLYYASRESLIEMGLDLSDRPSIGLTQDKLPKAFGNPYCPPPTGWTGK